jgi:hypothetical protein
VPRSRFWLFEARPGSDLNVVWNAVAAVEGKETLTDLTAVSTDTLMAILLPADQAFGAPAKRVRKVPRAQAARHVGRTG